MSGKDGIILILAISTTIFAALYMNARSDVEKVRHAGNMAYEMLSDRQKQALRDSWETRQDLLDQSSSGGQWDR